MKRATIILLIAVVFSSVLSSQTILVKGNVSTSTELVKNVLITFTDESDTTKSYPTLTDSLGNYNIGLITDINDNTSLIPTGFELAQNYPNPFSSSTAITYKLNKQADVQVTIYDILGREVKTYSAQQQGTGIHGVTWDGKNNWGMRISSGVYFYKVKTGNEMQIKKMIYSRGNSIPYTPLLSYNSFSGKKIEKNRLFVQTKTYTCRIENANNTDPRILTKEIEGIIIDRDTTLNFIVTDESDSYFPLNIGNEWTYQLIYDSPLAGPDIRTMDYQIITTKIVNGETYYGFNRTYIENGETYNGFIQTFPFSPEAFLVEDYDSVFVRQNEKGDIIFLIDDFEYPYFTFNPLLLGLTNRKKVKDTRYCYRIESINDTIVTPIGSFNKCFEILSSSTDFVDTDYYTWFAAGYGPVKIYYPEGGVTYELIKINIQNN
jgi:hypothetical protein